MLNKSTAASIAKRLKDSPDEWKTTSHYVFNQRRGIAVWTANSAYGLEVMKFNPQKPFFGIGSGRVWTPRWWGRRQIWRAVRAYRYTHIDNTSNDLKEAANAE